MIEDTYGRWRDLRSATEFEVTEQHLKLLKGMYVQWQETEFGAPEIDPKRPYGNSDVLMDIAEALEMKIPVDPGEDYDEDAARELFLDEYGDDLVLLHVETTVALQIALATQQFKAGRYRREPYTLDWKPVA